MRGHAENLTQTLEMGQKQLVEMQDTIESKEESIKSLTLQLMERKSEQEKIEKETQLQTQEMMQQIKGLQQQLSDVSIDFTFTIDFKMKLY